MALLSGISHETHSTIEQELEKAGCCLFQTEGDSMEPLLHNHLSTVAIERTSEALKKFDVALYQRPNGTYVLHRVVAIRKNYYLIRGDNHIYSEYVPKNWVIGKMVGFYPNVTEKYVDCTSCEYQDYIKGLRWRYVIQWTKALSHRINKSG